MISGFAIATLVVFVASIFFVIHPVKIPTPRPLPRIPINLTTAPIIAIALLWAAQCIDLAVIRNGTIGAEGIKPYNILILFFSLAYMALTLDITGVLQAVAIWVSNMGGRNGWRHYLYFYIMLTLLSILLGNDPVVLSGTAILVYYTQIAQLDPWAWVMTEFAAVNTASMVLFVGSPTNVVICEGFGVNEIAFTAYTILPFVACNVLCFVALVFQYRNKVPRKLARMPYRDPRSALLDPIGSWVGSIMLGANLILCLVVGFFGIDVWMISLPFAAGKFLFDLAWDHYRYTHGIPTLRRTTTRAEEKASGIAREGTSEEDTPSQDPSPTITDRSMSLSLDGKNAIGMPAAASQFGSYMEPQMSGRGSPIAEREGPEGDSVAEKHQPLGGSLMRQTYLRHIPMLGRMPRNADLERRYKACAREQQQIPISSFDDGTTVGSCPYTPQFELQRALGGVKPEAGREESLAEKQQHTTTDSSTSPHSSSTDANTTSPLDTLQVKLEPLMPHKSGGEKLDQGVSVERQRSTSDRVSRPSLTTNPGEATSHSEPTLEPYLDALRNKSKAEPQLVGDVETEAGEERPNAGSSAERQQHVESCTPRRSSSTELHFENNERSLPENPKCADHCTSRRSLSTDSKESFQLHAETTFVSRLESLQIEFTSGSVEHNLVRLTSPTNLKRASLPPDSETAIGPQPLQVPGAVTTFQWYWSYKDHIHRRLDEHFPTFITALPRLPFALVPFVFSQFILIEALDHQGWIDLFAKWLARASRNQIHAIIWLVGITGVILCNFSGTNIGATILLTKVIRAAAFPYEANRAAAIALAIASNVGAVSFTFSASHAGLLWRAILGQKGVHVRQRGFVLWNLLPIFVMTSVGLGVVSAEMAILFQS